MSILEKDVGELQGEIVTLRDQLDSNSATERKTAAKRVISLMRAGEDVSPLFASMLRCVKTNDLELKRFVYLYLVTFSSRESEQSIMAVNTFIQDSQDENPLVRALAIRTMSRIHIESVAEHFVVPIRQRLNDPSSFVRKTAAFSISRLYDIIPETIESSGLFAGLATLLHDENPMVVANATAAICEINSKRTEPIFEFTQENLGPYLDALPSCNEWCQTMLFDAISRYKPQSADDAVNLIDRLVPFLRHSNPAVVIGAFKCIFVFLDADTRPRQDVFAVILPPFLTLVSDGNTEIQFVVLRTLNLFSQKYPKALGKEIRIFFCKYNDPAYVKSEKLSIITANCGPANAGLVLDELGEYCNSVDVDFVRKAVKSIGEIALKMESCARKCVDILVGLVEGKAGYSVEQSVIVLSDILRKFPGQFESIIEKVCQNLDQMKDPHARAAGIWILGEYSSLIEKVDVVLDPFIDTFPDESPLVQLQLISSIVKIYLNRPDETRDQLQFVLNEATKNTMSPDIRNRALIYWRMLSMSPETARQFIQFQKTGVEHSGAQFTDEVLRELIANMGLVAGVLHILPSQFIVRKRETDPDDDVVTHSWKALQIVRSTNAVAIYSDWSNTELFLQILNRTDHQLTGFALALNGNGAGFCLNPGIKFPAALPAGETCEVSVPFLFRVDAIVAGRSAVDLDFALKTSDGVQYFRDAIDTRKVFGLSSGLSAESYPTFCQQHPDEVVFDLEDAKLAFAQELGRRNFTILSRAEHQIVIGFAIAGRDIACAIEIRGTLIHGTLRGEAPFFPLVTESAKYTFCRD